MSDIKTQSQEAKKKKTYLQTISSRKSNQHKPAFR